jgi:tetratricopeptide (TPR) repeat protein
MKILREILEDTPDYASALNNLAFILIDHDINIDEGMKLIQKAIEIDPDNHLYLDTQGLGLIKQSRFDEAVQVLQKARDLYPYYHHEIHQHLQQAMTSLN